MNWPRRRSSSSTRIPPWASTLLKSDERVAVVEAELPPSSGAAGASSPARSTTSTGSSICKAGGSRAMPDARRKPGRSQARCKAAAKSASPSTKSSSRTPTPSSTSTSTNISAHLASSMRSKTPLAVGTQGEPALHGDHGRHRDPWRASARWCASTTIRPGWRVVFTEPLHLTPRASIDAAADQCRSSEVPRAAPASPSPSGSPGWSRPPATSAARGRGPLRAPSSETCPRPAGAGRVGERQRRACLTVDRIVAGGFERDDERRDARSHHPRRSAAGRARPPGAGRRSAGEWAGTWSGARGRGGPASAPARRAATRSASS